MFSPYSLKSKNGVTLAKEVDGSMELTSRPSYPGTWSKKKIGIAVLFKAGRARMHSRLSRGKVLGEEILILDIGRNPAKGEESLPVGRDRVLHNVVIDQPVLISETPESMPAGKGSVSKTKESAAFQFRLNRKWHHIVTAFCAFPDWYI